MMISHLGRRGGQEAANDTAPAGHSAVAACLVRVTGRPTANPLIVDGFIYQASSGFCMAAYRRHCKMFQMLENDHVASCIGMTPHRG